MIKHIFKTLKSKNGMTLMELIVAMVVMAIITLSVSTIMLPMYRAYDLAVNLAEVNTILDNVSALILEDVAGAENVNWDSGSDVLIITAWNNSYKTVYYSVINGGNNVLMRAVRDSLNADKETPRPVLNPGNPNYGYYRNFNVVIENATVDTGAGIITITLTLFHRRAPDQVITRDYSIRPIGMQ